MYWTRITPSEAQRLRDEASDPYPHYWRFNDARETDELFCVERGPGQAEAVMADGSVMDLSRRQACFESAAYHRITAAEARELREEALYPRVFVPSDPGWYTAVIVYTDPTSDIWYSHTGEILEENTDTGIGTVANVHHEVTGHFTPEELLAGAGRERCGCCMGKGYKYNAFAMGSGMYTCTRCGGTGEEPDTLPEPSPTTATTDVDDVDESEERYYLDTRDPTPYLFVRARAQDPESGIKWRETYVMADGTSYTKDESTDALSRSSVWKEVPKEEAIDTLHSECPILPGGMEVTARYFYREDPDKCGNFLTECPIGGENVILGNRIDFTDPNHPVIEDPCPVEHFIFSDDYRALPFRIARDVLARVRSRGHRFFVPSEMIVIGFDSRTHVLYAYTQLGDDHICVQATGETFSETGGQEDLSQAEGWSEISRTEALRLEVINHRDGYEPVRRHLKEKGIVQ